MSPPRIRCRFFMINSLFLLTNGKDICIILLMLKKEDIILNQIVVALGIGLIWWIASSVDPSGAEEFVGTLAFAWIATAIVGCFEKFE